MVGSFLPTAIVATLLRLFVVLEYLLLVYVVRLSLLGRANGEKVEECNYKDTLALDSCTRSKGSLHNRMSAICQLGRFILGDGIWWMCCEQGTLLHQDRRVSIVSACNQYGNRGQV